MNARLPSLRSNFGWTVLGNGLYGLCQWGTIAILAQLGTTEQVGRFALGFAIAAPIFLFADLNLRSLQATDAENRYSIGDYLGLRLVALVVALVAVVAIALLAGMSADKARIVVAVAVAKAFESIAFVIYGFLQKHERMARIAISMIVKGVASVAVVGVVIALTARLDLAVVALAAAWAATLVLIDLPAARRLAGGSGESLRPRFVWSELGRLAWLALPLGLTRLLGSLETNAPRYLVELRLGEGALGIFAAMSYLVLIGNRVVHALAQATSQRMARYRADDDRAAALRLLGIWIALGLALAGGAVGGAILLGRPVLERVYGPAYAAEQAAFVWIVIAGGLGYLGIFFDYALTVLRRLRLQAVIRALSLITILSACILWITESGLLGVGRALAVGASVQLVLAAAATGLFWRRSRAATDGVGR